MIFWFCVLTPQVGTDTSLKHFNLFSTPLQAKACGFNLIHIITIILEHFIFTMCVSICICRKDKN